MRLSISRDAQRFQLLRVSHIIEIDRKLVLRQALWDIDDLKLGLSSNGEPLERGTSLQPNTKIEGDNHHE